MKLLLSLALLPHALAWLCIPIQTKTIREGVVWKTQNCTMDETKDLPLKVVNSIHIDMNRNDIRVVPAIADPVAQVQGMPDIGATNPNFIAGINGGYFWRVDMDGFWRDNVCRGKLRKEAEQPASPLNPNFGIGDGLIKIDGKVLANNCNCTGFSRPAVLKLAGLHSGIEVLHRGETVDHTVLNAIGAGPNLVSFNESTGESYIDVPKDDDNVNKVVYEATTAVGLTSVKGLTNSLVMVTTDGSDDCLPNESYCGLFSPDLASLMKEVFGCSVAMSMDQGGSTGMWIKGENPSRNGMISRSDNKSPVETEGARKIANGLFLEVVASA